MYEDDIVLEVLRMAAELPDWSFGTPKLANPTTGRWEIPFAAPDGAWDKISAKTSDEFRSRVEDLQALWESGHWDVISDAARSNTIT